MKRDQSSSWPFGLRRSPLESARRSPFHVMAVASAHHSARQEGRPARRARPTTAFRRYPFTVRAWSARIAAHGSLRNFLPAIACTFRTKTTMKKSVSNHRLSYAAQVNTPLKRCLVRAVEIASGCRHLERLYRNNQRAPRLNESFWAACIRHLRLDVQFDPAALDKAPATGRRASSYLSPHSGGHRPFIVMRFDRADERLALRVQRNRSNGFPIARCA